MAVNTFCKSFAEEYDALPVKHNLLTALYRYVVSHINFSSATCLNIVKIVASDSGRILIHWLGWKQHTDLYTAHFTVKRLCKFYRLLTKKLSDVNSLGSRL